MTCRVQPHPKGEADYISHFRTSFQVGQNLWVAYTLLNQNCQKPGKFGHDHDVWLFVIFNQKFFI